MLNFKEYVAQVHLHPEEELEMLNGRLMRFNKMKKYVKGLEFEIWEMLARKKALETALRLMNGPNRRNKDLIDDKA